MKGHSQVLRFTVVLVLYVIPLSAGVKQVELETWKDRTGKGRTRADLQEILHQHKLWLESDGKSGARADLGHADLKGEPLASMNLSKAYLGFANLTGASLTGSDLMRADLNGAKLARANLREANFEQANLAGADLSDARAENTNLRGAILVFLANLTRADLRGANLADADLSWAIVHSTIFEPKANPESRLIAQAMNLAFMTYDRNPEALVQLRKQFRDGGFLRQEREITYALRRREAEILLDGCRRWADLRGCAEYMFKRAFFDWTCRYGMDPGRPLRLGLVLLLLCSLVYAIAIHLPGQSGLYRIETGTALQAHDAKSLVARIDARPLAPAGLARYGPAFVLRELNVLWIALFFSLMCAFNIGFRDINFGRWLRLLTIREYDIKAIGWVRPIAGVQSLLSVYLIALWFLTYFGRPFE